MPVIPSRGAELLEIQFEKLQSSDTKSRPPSQALRKPYPRVAERVPEHLSSRVLDWNFRSAIMATSRNR
jgi:hypothetical protein